MFATMAMYIETTREKGTGDATTLEEAAEELLNGLLCHYEPPDPRTNHKLRKEAGQIKRTRSILKPSNPFKKKGVRGRGIGQRVKWKDEQNRLKTPDLYDIGKGCQEAIAECNSKENSSLERETEILADLSSRRQPRPISKRHRHHEEGSTGDIHRQHSANMATFSEDSSNLMNNYSGTNSDPVSNYRAVNMSPKNQASRSDDTDSLFDDLGNVVQDSSQYDVGSRNSYGPPPSPSPKNARPPRRLPTPYKQRPLASHVLREGAQPSTLCGMMCDPQYLNCEVQDDGEYSEDNYHTHGPPPPPPPPPPPHYYYEDPENSLVSGSEGGDYSEEERNEEVENVPTRGFGDRFRRRSKKKSSKRPPAEEDEPRSRGRSQSRSPGRERSKSPNRSKSPGKSRKEKKFPRSPMSFITGNRSFSDAGSPKENSEPNLSMHSADNDEDSLRRAPKSPKSPRRWFSRGKEKDRDGGNEHQVPDPMLRDNDDWVQSQKPDHVVLNTNTYGDSRFFQPEVGNMGRLDQFQRQHLEGLDTIDRSRLSDFMDQNEVLQDPHSAYTQNPSTGDVAGSRLPSYGRPESHIGLSRMSFDDSEAQQQNKPSRSRSLEKLGEMLRPRRGRSKERSENPGLSQSRSRSLDRQDQELHTARSRSVDRFDQRQYSLGYGYDGRLTPTSRDPGIDGQEGLGRTPSRNFDGPVDSRRTSYPFVNQEQLQAYYNRGYAPEGFYNGQRFTYAPQQPIPQWQHEPPVDTSQQGYLVNQYQHPMLPQRSPSYPPNTPTGGGQTHVKSRRSFDYSDIRQGINQTWGAARNPEPEQRKMAAEPPAAIYSHLQEPPQQLNTIYSHDLRAAPVPAMQGWGMPPTPMERGQQYSQYAGQMPPIPLQQGYPMYQQPITDAYHERSQSVPQKRDPTPRNQLLEFIQSQFQTSRPARPASPQRQPTKLFSVAEEIHRVSWGEPRSKDSATAPKVNEKQSQRAVANNTMQSLGAPIPVQLPGTVEEKRSLPQPPPPPPPPPPEPSTPQEQSQENYTVRKKPISKSRPAAAPVLQYIAEDKQVEFTDEVDENKPVDSGGKKDGTGKGGSKLLGIFHRSRKKKISTTRKSQDDSEGADTPDIDIGSIMSDAVLRDRVDRFKTTI